MFKIDFTFQSVYNFKLGMKPLCIKGNNHKHTY